ncbi:MAG: DUF2786 domain-containing protein [Sporichthyaceae bacterium]
MGTSNRNRRAARERARDRAVGAGALDEMLGEIDEDLSSAEDVVQRLFAEGLDERSRQALGREAAALGATVLAAVTAAGWTPADLREIVRRRLSPPPLGELAEALAAQQDRHGAQVDPAWREQVAALGAVALTDPASPIGLGRSLFLTAFLTRLPAIAETLPPPGRPGRVGAAAPRSAHDAKQLARVRALLAKAESTAYDAEAEALSTKAQELISRHALQRLLDQAEHGPPEVTARRIWLEDPYLMAKASLVGAVAGANRVRAVISDDLGFATLVGDPADLDAVELLSTSLLVQANAAMLRHGGQVDLNGASRTRAFRQSFLVAFGHRIAQRLTATDAAAVTEDPDRERLLPALHAAREAVETETARLFPSVRSRSARVSDADGWAAGQAAADQARLELGRNPLGRDA